MGSGHNYAVEEIKALIEGYRPLREAVSASPRRLWLLVRLIDLDEAIDTVPLLTRQALVLCGVHGFTRQEAATLVGVNEKTMDRRYSAGLSAMAEWLNGITPSSEGASV